MGAYDSAQIADLIGFYVLDYLGRIVEHKQMSLYGDDGIIYIPISNNPLMSKIMEKVIRAFKLLGLKIEISSNLKIVDYLDITLNLNDNTFKSYLQVNETPDYINIHFNHRVVILKQIPNTISSRINCLSSNKDVFKKSKKKLYENTLQKSELKNNILLYSPPNNNARILETKRQKKKKGKECRSTPPYASYQTLTLDSTS